MSEGRVPHVEPITPNLAEPLLALLDRAFELQEDHRVWSWTGQIIAAAKAERPEVRAQWLAEALESLQHVEASFRTIRTAVERELSASTPGRG